jgi:hypothetical protein
MRTGQTREERDMDIVYVHRRAVEAWQRKVDGVREDMWGNATPCTAWSVRDLTNHVVAEELWMVPLLQGSTSAEVGDRFRRRRAG